MKIYKTFEEWKNGYWLEDGEPRTKAYTNDELLLVEMGWKYGCDAGADRIAELEKCAEPVAWIDEINTFVLDKDYNQFPKSLQNGMIPLYTTPQTKPLCQQQFPCWQYD